MIINLTLYSHNLKESSHSFNTKFKLKDFNFNCWKLIDQAVNVNYMNPKGEIVSVKTKKPRGIYDVD